jgi:MDMPI C-terminal domain
VQEAAVHGRDAQEAAGHAEPVPAAIAMDSVDEFLTVSLGSSAAWPHQPARISLRTSEGAEWLVDLGEKGAMVVAVDEGTAGGPAPAMSVAGGASDLLLVLYGRLGPDAVHVGGERGMLGQLIDWVPCD